MSEREFARCCGKADRIRSNTVSRLRWARYELYERDPPLCGYRVVAASKSSGAMRIPTPPERRRIRSRQRLRGGPGGDDLQIMSRTKATG